VCHKFMILFNASEIHELMSDDITVLLCAFEKAWRRSDASVSLVQHQLPFDYIHNSADHASSSLIVVSKRRPHAYHASTQNTCAVESIQELARRKQGCTNRAYRSDMNKRFGITHERASLEIYMRLFYMSRSDDIDDEASRHILLDRLDSGTRVCARIDGIVDSVCARRDQE